MLQWLAPALLVDTWNASMAAVMRAHLRVRDTLAVMLVMNLCQLGLAALLMHGAGPLPALGLPGFALSLAVSRGVGLALHLWIWRRRLGLKPASADWWRVPRDELRAVLRIGVPGAAENIAYRLAFTVSVSAVATLGAPALATQARSSHRFRLLRRERARLRFRIGRWDWSLASLRHAPTSSP
jgi:Na+-driven multidrug efflux pump